MKLFSIILVTFSIRRNKMKLKIVLTLILSLIFFGCSGSGTNKSNDNGGNPNNKPEQNLNWDSIPAEFNPSIDEVDFAIDGLEKINIDAFGFKDVEVIYSTDLAANEGILRIFKVWKKQASWGDLRANKNGKNLDLKNYGTYQCSIKIENRQITSLEGGCYVRVQILMPQGSEVEIYNIGKLVTQRFIAMDNQTFLKSLDDATWADDKFKVIEDYLSTYNGTKKPILYTTEMSKVINEFIRSDEKLRALKMLHSYIADRDNLPTMIDREFNSFDRDEAETIVGL